MRVFFPIEDSNGVDASASLVPYRCGLPFALRIDADEARRGENAQRLTVISSPGASPIARDCPALSSST